MNHKIIRGILSVTLTSIMMGSGVSIAYADTAVPVSQQKVKLTSSYRVTYSAYRGKAVARVRTVVNMRQSATTGSSVVGKFGKGDMGSVLSNNGTWSRIKSGSVTGYVRNDYLVMGSSIFGYASNNNFPKKVKVTASSLKVRKKASTSSRKVTSVKRGKSYKIRKIKNGKWAYIKVNGKKGYVSMDYTKVYYYFTKAEASKAASSNASQTTTAASNTSSLRTRLVSYAKQFIGNRYVYGGNSLTNGVDCSGFTQQVYRHFGYYINRTAATQANNGTAISVASALPGDLLFYRSGKSKISHVAIYIGNGQIVHASNSKPYPQGGIKISSSRYQTPCKAVRLIR